METPAQYSTLVDPSAISVLGVIDQPAAAESPNPPPENKLKKEQTVSKAKKPSPAASTDSKIAELDLKWPERFNRLEALLLARSLQPTFSSEVRVMPSHFTPPNVSKDSEPFFQPTSSLVGNKPTVECIGPDTTVEKQMSTGKLSSDQQEDSSFKHTGPDKIVAEEHKSAGKLQSVQSSQGTSSKRTDPDEIAAEKRKSVGKLLTDRPPQGTSSGRTGPDEFVAGKHKLAGKP